MSTYTVDACVAAKWFFPEVHTDAAVKLLKNQHDLIAPELIHAEVANIVWKKQRTKEIDAEVARDAIKTFSQFVIEKVRHRNIIHAALDLAMAYDRTVYDSLYLATAIYTDSTLVTADKKFYNAINRSDYAEKIMWIEDLS